MMLKDTNANAAAIAAIATAGKPYYWVNVGVRKYFTADIAEAYAFVEECGDSLYRGNSAGHGELVSEFKDGPQAYSVEVEYMPQPGINDHELPENWTSRQFDQMEAERVMGNSMRRITHETANGLDMMAGVGEIIIRLCRNGCGKAVETHRMNWLVMLAKH